jgi:hypothetical protein
MTRYEFEDLKAKFINLLYELINVNNKYMSFPNQEEEDHIYDKIQWIALEVIDVFDELYILVDDENTEESNIH